MSHRVGLKRATVKTHTTRRVGDAQCTPWEKSRNFLLLAWQRLVTKKPGTAQGGVGQFLQT